MRYERTESFKADYRRLSEAERKLFRVAVKDFNEGCQRYILSKDPSDWPHSLRVQSVTGAKGIWEMTWHFSGPDGRATWEWTEAIDSEGKKRPAVRWRRIGDHYIFKNP